MATGFTIQINVSVQRSGSDQSVFRWCVEKLQPHRKSGVSFNRVSFNRRLKQKSPTGQSLIVSKYGPTVHLSTTLNMLFIYPSLYSNHDYKVGYNRRL